MALDFARSQRSTIGVEWELQILDPAGDLSPVAPQLLQEVEHRAPGNGLIHQEMLRNTIELVSRKRTTVAGCAQDLQEALELLAPVLAEHRVELAGAGSHPFAEPGAQAVSETERYSELVERTQYWGRQMLIFGTHVHVGVEDRAKVVPIMRHLATYLGHIQSLSASSPFWDGLDTGFADNRAMMFQQLPNAGLPEPFTNLAELEELVAGLTRVGAIGDISELRWDLRPAPRLGTVEVRVCDAASNMLELRAVAALIHCLVEDASRALDAGDLPKVLPHHFVTANKWRSARYGMDAVLIEDARGRQEPVRLRLPALVARLEPVAADLGCAGDLDAIVGILAGGVGYERQRAVAQRTGSLDAVVAHLRSEMGAGRPLDPGGTPRLDAVHAPVSGNRG